jgi:ABC-type multidrug transport system fused ATPase/permease subunit
MNTDITKAHAGGNYILNLRHRHPSILDSHDARDPDSEGAIEFHDVHFRYPLRKNVPVLRGIDLTVSRLQSPSTTPPCRL